MKGKLYLVATPIGNLDDITLRAINILKEVDLIAAEDTRHTLKLLNHLQITKPLISYYKQNEKIKSNVLIDKLLNGENIAINALITSGLDTSEFVFIGFLPTNKKEKKEKMEEVKRLKQTLIFYEAPHKLINTLEGIKEVLGDRQIVLAKEITKIHEEYIRGTASEVMEKINSPKGEFVIIIEGSKENIKGEEQKILNELSLDEHYEYYKNQNFEKKDIIKKIAKDRNKSRNEIYQYFLNK